MKQYLEYIGKAGQELLDIKKAGKDFQVENSMLNYQKTYFENFGEVEELESICGVCNGKKMGFFGSSCLVASLAVLE